jgi:protein-disulfide isomerase
MGARPLVIPMDSDEPTRRQILSLSGVAAATGLAGCASLAQQADSDGTPTSGSTPSTTPDAGGSDGNQTGNETGSAKQQAEPITIEEPSFGVSGATVPDETASVQYPVMGTAEETVTLWGNWKCPYTREFVAGPMGSLVDEFVAPGDVSLQYRAVAYENGEPSLGPDSPRATQAGLAVWDIDPESFWSYFAYVFENQPPEDPPWATMDTLVRFARAADVKGIDQVRQAIRSKGYAAAVQATADRAPEVGVTTFPRVVYDGSVTAPTRNPEATRRQFERAADAN